MERPSLLALVAVFASGGCGHAPPSSGTASTDPAPLPTTFEAATPGYRVAFVRALAAGSHLPKLEIQVDGRPYNTVAFLPGKHEVAVRFVVTYEMSGRTVVTRGDRRFEVDVPGGAQKGVLLHVGIAERPEQAGDDRFAVTVRGVPLAEDVAASSPPGTLAGAPSHLEYIASVPKPTTRDESGDTTALMKVCVDAVGSVKSVKMVKGVDPQFDGRLVAAMSQNLYRPTSVGGKAVPYCYMLRVIVEGRR